MQRLQRERERLITRLEDVNARLAEQRRNPAAEELRPLVAFRHVPAQHAGREAWDDYKRTLPGLHAAR